MGNILFFILFFSILIVGSLILKVAGWLILLAILAIAAFLIKKLVKTYLKHGIKIAPPEPPPEPEKFDIRTIPMNSRMAHQLVIAGADHGKTSLLEVQIHNDLMNPDSPAMVVIDSKGDMIENIARLDIFHPDRGSHRDRLIIVDARDSPQLNMFDVNLKRLVTYDQQSRETILNGMYSMYSYFFSALLATAMTSQQGTLFYPLAHLMTHIPGAGLRDMMRAMQDIEPFRADINKLPEDVRNFLLIDLQKKNYDDTKLQVRRRLQAILLQNESFARMFAAPHNMVDLPEAINQRKIVLVSTEEGYLGREFSAIFGRFFVASTINAALRRSTIPPDKRLPAFLYIDEAIPYFDEKTEELLRTLRSYRMGGVIAFQEWSRVSNALQSALKTNTSIKLIGGSLEKEAKEFAKEMKTTPDFIMAQERDNETPPRFTRFAAHVRNSPMPGAMTALVPIGHLKKQKQMNDHDYERMRRLNRERLNPPAPPKATAAPPPPPPPPQDPPEQPKPKPKGPRKTKDF